MSFRTDLLAQAVAEFDAMGGAKEPGASSSQSAAKTEKARALIAKYWMEGLGRSATNAASEISARTAWSAAFISFCVRKALQKSGNAAVFDFSASHSVYIGQSLRNDFGAVPKPAFYGEPPTGIGKVKLAVGDIVGWSRTANIASYEDALAAARATPQPKTYYSHCDIVIDVSNGKATLIGGNVSNSVSKSSVNLDADGCVPVRPFRYNSAGTIISGPYIVVIQHR